MVRPTAVCRAAFLCLVVSGLFAACSNTTSNNNINKVAGPAIYEGFHDITNCNGIMGWAWDKNQPDQPIQVEIYDGNALLATVTADEFREDLLKAGIGNGKHGFTYPVPPRLKDGKPHSIRMKYASTAIELTNTPREINCSFTP
jgi:hypothetical protein